MPVTLATVDLDRLDRRYTALKLRLAALQGRASELQTQKTRLTQDISLAKARIELAPQAAEVFKYLQDMAHSRAVGDFEELLSAFVADVVPDAGRIHLELDTERGAPSLDIWLDNGGDLENIYHGNGGGLTNVVVTGLGYSALSRTSNRQLMLLDEPDCWLQASDVPNFTKVIAEVANPSMDEDGNRLPGCQTLMISHNDISLMDPGAHIQKLHVEKNLAAYADQLGVKVEYVGDEADSAYVVFVPGSSGRKGHIEVRYRKEGEGSEEQNALTKGYPCVSAIGGSRVWDDDMPGIRWVEVVNLRHHVMTRLELSPGLNVLTGNINGGKSTLYFAALRAMAYGETDDTMIRHGADAAYVRMGLENDIVLEVVRTRKGSPKVLYRLYNSSADFRAGKPAHEGRPEKVGSVPSFISDVLKVEKVDNMDIQLRSQKEPVFLLNESPSRRAKLLSVGRESGLLQELIERHRLQNRRDKDAVKRDEIELNLVNRSLTALAPAASLTAMVDIMDGMMDDCRTSDARVKETRELVAKLSPLEGRVKLLAAMSDTLNETPALPVLVQTKPLSDLISRIERTEPYARFPELPVAPSVPALADTRSLQGLVSAINKGQDAEALASLLRDAPVAPQLIDTMGLRRDGKNLADRKAALDSLMQDDKAASLALAEADAALHQLKHDLGVCPTCNQTFLENAGA